MNTISLYLVDNYFLTRISWKKYLNLQDNIEVLGDFKDAGECFKAIAAKQPNIVILDVELPQINGIEACRIIKEKYPKIKVVIFTTCEDYDKVLASLSCGACAYAVKGKSDIIKVIGIVMQEGIWIEPELSRKAFSKLPAANLKNLENPYKYENYKEILTQRELEVLKFIIEGKTNAQIAKEIVVSTNTIKAHVGNILEKLGAVDRVQAAVIAVRANLF